MLLQIWNEGVWNATQLLQAFREPCRHARASRSFNPALHIVHNAVGYVKISKLQ